MFAAALVSCSKPSPTLPGVAGALEKFVAGGEVAGFVSLVADRDGLRHLHAQGLADIASARPMREDTIFWIASMTKPVTGVAVMMLVDEGKVALADPVAKYIPEFAALRTPSGAPANLTIEHILTHTSGLGDLPTEVYVLAPSIEDLVNRYLTLPMQFEPGTRWSYCQSGINTACRIVEIVSGQRFEAFLQERLFTPLGMKDTTFFPTDAQIPRIATPYAIDPASRALVPGKPGRDVHNRRRAALGNGGLFSTARDYAQFARMLLRRGELDGRRYLSEAAVATLASDRTRGLEAGWVPGTAWGVATAVVREPADVAAALSPGSFGHGGAHGTQAWIDPVRGNVQILLFARSDIGNSDGSAMRGAFHAAVAEALRK
jgi:CubicO group peptidase (beta-lactamase class C family)